MNTEIEFLSDTINYINDSENNEKKEKFDNSIQNISCSILIYTISQLEIEENNFENKKVYKEVLIKLSDELGRKINKNYTFNEKNNRLEKIR